MANRNAYLRVALDAVALDRMAALAKFLADSEEVGGAQGFRAMARDTIHMTFFFAGEHLAQLSSEDLTRFYTAVSAAVSQFPIVVDASTTRLRLQRLALFPPEKNNLVVAQFAASPELHALQARVEDIAAAMGVGNSGSARRVDGTIPTNSEAAVVWQPHVTLGKVCASSNQVEIVGKRLLAAGTRSLAEPVAARLMDSFEASGISMGGLAPKQVWLDWNLRFLPKTEPEPEPELEPELEAEPYAWYPKEDPQLARVRALDAAGEFAPAAHLLRMVLYEQDPLGRRPKLHAHLARLEQLVQRNGDNITC